MNKLIIVINNSKDNSNHNSNFSLIMDKLCIILEGNLALYLKPSSNKKKICNSLRTLIMFLYIIYYNIEKPENIITFFKMNFFNLIKILKKAINIFKDDKENNSLANFIINICFDDMKKKVYSFNDKELEEFYQKHVYSEILGK